MPHRCQTRTPWQASRHAGLDSSRAPAQVLLLAELDSQSSQGLNCRFRMGNSLHTVRVGLTRRRLLTADCRCARLLSISLLLCVLWDIPATGRGSDAPPSLTLRQSASSVAWDQGGASADFDGDGRPDLAIVRAEGRGAKGFSYRVELQLSTRRDLSFFRVSAAPGGLHIVPRDVNGDGELDLVVTSAWSRLPVGVWINDGHGVFTQGDAAVYPQTIWIESPVIYSQTRRETFTVAVPESYRFCVDSGLGSHFSSDVVVERLAFLPASTSPRAVAVSRPQTRSPPRARPQQSS